MEHLRFRCDVCGEIVQMKKDVIPPFADWGYNSCVEWSDFEDDVPALNERHWQRSSVTPFQSQRRLLFVQKPFDEAIGSTFWVKFEPALLALNGWDDVLDTEIQKCAMVRCRFERILSADTECAWIEVSILQVVPLHELYRHYSERIVTHPLDLFHGFEKETETIFRNEQWHIVGWSAQGDCGQTNWIFTDDSGTPHLVLALSFGYEEEVLHMGNILSIRI